MDHQLGSIDGTHGFARGVWNMLRDGGAWTVPRCGLIYRKREEDKQLVLVARLPWSEGMPFSPESLEAFQDEDHEGIEAIFRSIGVQVVEA